MFGIFGLGVQELIILGVMGLGMLVAGVVVVVVLTRGKKDDPANE